MQEILSSSPISGSTLVANTIIRQQTSSSPINQDTKQQISDNSNSYFYSNQNDFQNYYQNSAVAASLLQHHYQNYHSNISAFTVNNLANLGENTQQCLQLPVTRPESSLVSHLQKPIPTWRSTPPSSFSSSKNSSPNTNTTNTSSSSEHDYYSNNQLIDNSNQYELQQESAKSIFATIGNNSSTTLNEHTLLSSNEMNNFPYTASTRTNLFPNINSSTIKSFVQQQPLSGNFSSTGNNFYNMTQFDSNNYQSSYYNRNYAPTTPISSNSAINPLLFSVNQTNNYLSPIDTNNSSLYPSTNSVKNYDDLENKKNNNIPSSLQTSPNSVKVVNSHGAVLSSSSSCSFTSSPTSVSSSSNKNSSSSSPKLTVLSNQISSTTTQSSTNTSTSSPSSSSMGVSSTQVLQAESFEWMKPVKSAPNGKTRTKDKYRVVYSEPQRVELEKEFLYSKYITIKRKSELSQTLSLSERQIKIWFQNRRAKERKSNRKQKSHDNNGVSSTTKTMNKNNQNDYSDDEDMDEEFDDSMDEEDSNDAQSSSNKISKSSKSKQNSKKSTDISAQKGLLCPAPITENAYSAYPQANFVQNLSTFTNSYENANNQNSAYSQYSPNNSSAAYSNQHLYQAGYSSYPQQGFVNGQNFDYTNFIGNQQQIDYNSTMGSSANSNHLQQQHNFLSNQFNNVNNDYLINRGFVSSSKNMSSSPTLQTTTSSSNSLIQVLSQFQSI